MIGRLVHDEEIGFGGQHFTYSHTLDFPSGKFLHFFRKIRQFEAGEELLDSQFVSPQAFLVHALGERGTAAHDLVKYSLFRVKAVFLFEKGYPDILQESDLSSGIGFVLACQYSQQGCLSRAVRCDQGYLVAFIYIESYVFEQDLGSVGF